MYLMNKATGEVLTQTDEGLQILPKIIDSKDPSQQWIFDFNGELYFWFKNNEEIIHIYFPVYNHQVLNDNCFEFVKETENDVTYDEAKDHCENKNGSLINENRLTDVKNV